MENNSQVTIIYNDIEYIKVVLTSDEPYNYASINMEVTAKYDSIPDVGNIKFYKTTLEFLESKSDAENMENLSMIAQSLQILMFNVKLGQIANVVLNSVLEHSVNAGSRALFKSSY